MTFYTNSIDYLRLSSKSRFDGLREVDPEVIWFMKEWLFINETYF